MLKYYKPTASISGNYSFSQFCHPKTHQHSRHHQYLQPHQLAVNRGKITKFQLSPHTPIQIAIPKRLKQLKRFFLALFSYILYFLNIITLRLYFFIPPHSIRVKPCRSTRSKFCGVGTVVGIDCNGV